MRPSAAAVCAIALLAAAGCGGDSDPESSSAPATQETASPPPETTAATGGKAGYIVQADVICSSLHAPLRALNARRDAFMARGNTSAAEEFALIEEIFSQAAEITERGVRRLQSLTPPQEAGKALADFLAAVDDQAQALQELAEAGARMDPAAVREVTTRMNEIGARRQAAAKAFGFKRCGS